MSVVHKASDDDTGRQLQADGMTPTTNAPDVAVGNEIAQPQCSNIGVDPLSIHSSQTHWRNNETILPVLSSKTGRCDRAVLSERHPSLTSVSASQIADDAELNRFNHQDVQWMTPSIPFWPQQLQQQQHHHEIFSFAFSPLYTIRISTPSFGISAALDDCVHQIKTALFPDYPDISISKLSTRDIMLRFMVVVCLYVSIAALWMMIVSATSSSSSLSLTVHSSQRGLSILSRRWTGSSHNVINLDRRQPWHALSSSLSASPLINNNWYMHAKTSFAQQSPVAVATTAAAAAFDNNVGCLELQHQHSQSNMVISVAPTRQHPQDEIRRFAKHLQHHVGHKVVKVRSLVDTHVTTPIVSTLERIKPSPSPNVQLLQQLKEKFNIGPKQQQQQQRQDATHHQHHQGLAHPSSKQLQYLMEPTIPESVWERLTGTEFQDHPELLDGLAEMGETLARIDSNSYTDIVWTPYGSTLSGSLDKGDIHVWTGKIQSNQAYGKDVPMIKTRSIVPFSPVEMKELLLDSDRVKTYNPWSLGRRDLWIMRPSNDHPVDQQTKIVQNQIQPPFGSKPMISTTLLHARRLNAVATTNGIESRNNDTWLVISRAVGGDDLQWINSSTDRTTATGRSDIMLGINLLQPLPGNTDSCLLTSVTHVYSNSVPTMLAERLGVTSAMKFVKDMRVLKSKTKVAV